jgi:uncharacterized protein (DUF1501 family)
MKSTRRSFLATAAGATAAGMGLHVLDVPLLRNRLLAAPVLGNKKLLFIFQRGGMDGIHAVIPRGDNEYNLTNRPTLFVPESEAYDLDNGFAQLHPRAAPLQEVFEAGDLAIVHRVGYNGQSRSHFDSQKYWENGTLDRELEVGIFNRHLAASLAAQGNDFAAVGLASNLMVALRGPTAVTNFERPEEFRFRGTDAVVAKFVGNVPGPGLPGRGFLGFYGGAPSFPEKPYRDALHRTGVAVADAMALLRDGDIEAGGYVPAGGAEYPDGEFGEKLKIAAQLLKSTPVQVLGIDLDGWDTHSGQAGRFDELIYDLAMGFRALSRDLSEIWQDTTVVTMTEFGRTSRENGSRGTDHAEATVLWVGGGAVNGGVYNCDASTWKNGHMFSAEGGRYLAHRTDFRSVLSEIFAGHFGDSEDVLAQTIPNLAQLRADDPVGFEALGIF